MKDGWLITFDKQTFERSKKDKRFPYILTLGRAVNALYVVHAATMREVTDSPRDKRDKFNAFLFGSALMFECLNLIETMIATFGKEERFKKGLRALLDDETSKQIKKAHLKGVRHQAVFHFDAAAFAKSIEKTQFYTCSFVTGEGEPKHEQNYELADIVATEILVGLPSDSAKFMSVLADAMQKTSALINRFINEAEEFMVEHLQEWGYWREDLQ